MNEEWRAIEDYPGYEVSNRGNVRRTNGKPVTAHPFAGGYLRVWLKNEKGLKNRTIHALVLKAFVGPRPPGYQTRHLNNIRTDNRVENLAWGTATDNYRDRELNGTDQRGDRHGSRKLDSNKVLIARFLYSQKTQRSWGADLLAKEWGVDRSTINRVARGKGWDCLNEGFYER